MAEMTATPVATHGFSWTGGGWKRATSSTFARPTTARSSRMYTRDAANTPKPPLPPLTRPSEPHAGCPPSSANEFCARLLVACTIAKKNSPARIALEAGKPIKSARAEVDRAVFTFNVAAEETVRGYGEYLPLDWQQSTAGRWGIVKRFPLGPIAGITPFNFPFEPGRAQSRSRHRRRLFHGAQARAANAAYRAAAGGSDPAGGMAGWRIQRASALQRRFRRCWSPMNASSSSALRAAPRSAGPSRTMRERKKSFSNWEAIPASSFTAMPISPTPPIAALPEASPTPDSPAFRCSAFWSSTRSTENSPSCCWRECAN